MSSPKREKPKSTSMASKSQRPKVGGTVSTLLPNAPLTEVVFEFRWQLLGGEEIPGPFKMDPGFHVLADKFPSAVAKLGFDYSKKMSVDPAPPAYSIDRRFYRSENQPFPLLQIGPGIFAANESSGYEWANYREMCLSGLKCLLSAYPPMDSFKVHPNYLELRYIDTFDADLISGKDFLVFLNENTNIRIDHPSPDFALLEGVSAGQLALNFRTKLPKDGTFSVLVGSAKRDDLPSIILQSKVVSNADVLPAGKTAIDQIRFVKRWLDEAHAVTSSYFKGFVRQELMQKFAGKSSE